MSNTPRLARTKAHKLDKGYLLTEHTEHSRHTGHAGQSGQAMLLYDQYAGLNGILNRLRNGHCSTNGVHTDHVQ